MDIMALLPVGEANAIPSKQLADMCGFSNVRELQKAIEALRCSGEIICSTGFDGGGYYIHANVAELRNYVNTCQNRAKNTFRSLGAAKRALKQMESDQYRPGH